MSTEVLVPVLARDRHTISKNAGAPPSPPSGIGTGSGYTLLHLVGEDGVAGEFAIDSFGVAPVLHLRRAQGTNASKTAIQAGNRIGLIGAIGYYASAYTDHQAALQFIATEDWTSSARGTRAIILATPIGTNGMIEVFQAGPEGIGYGAAGLGMGGAVTQSTNKSTGVTLDKPCGRITMNNAALGANTAVSFTLTNSTIGADDTVRVCIKSGATADSYHVDVTAVAAGSCRIQVHNFSGGSLGEALVLNFAVLKGAAS